MNIAHIYYNTRVTPKLSFIKEVDYRESITIWNESVRETIKGIKEGRYSKREATLDEIYPLEIGNQIIKTIGVNINSGDKYVNIYVDINNGDIEEFIEKIKHIEINYEGIHYNKMVVPGIIKKQRDKLKTEKMEYK